MADQPIRLSGESMLHPDTLPTGTAPSKTSRIFLALLIFFGCLESINPLYSTPLKILLGNEGWLAMTIASWREGLPLYPAPDEFFVAHYPPLAYAPYRLLEALFGDVILPGRILSGYYSQLSAFACLR
jgi:hypothetical protein